MKIGFDIGGLISRYPEQMIKMIYALESGAIEVHLITDMKKEDALKVCALNNVIVPSDWIHSADWSKHGDRCKAVLCHELGIDIMIDDRPDYVADGNFIGLVLSPRPDTPYYHPGWHNAGTPTVCVPAEEYEAFKAWRALQQAVEQKGDLT